MRDNLWDLVIKTRLGRRLYWGTRWGRFTPKAPPHAPWPNAVLQSRREWQAAVEHATAIGLPTHQDGPKNWDCLAALHAILEQTGPDARVLDAGSEVYSAILPWLALYGYRDLVGINLKFGERFAVGPVAYEHGDITRTHFADAHFDAVTCLSVIEHNVPVEPYLREMARILKPGGILVTSFDYFDPPLDTTGLTAYGGPVRVFDRAGVQEILELARGLGLEPTSEVDLSCGEKPVTWRRFKLQFTFAVITLRKAAQEVA
ncbi:MAG: class I SAM-dependent methyltransferase [Nannocystis sp.]|uniref:class I SAM-dependent methyltransferase n=1 Tax=Nannocystis sp. TaxID=1962667 RepID=UPI0024252A98|nr:class I SAM-dependent methyltransferase [Nannocystis sp.]MBK9757259.1 class I SAM-dependent methyltransferase [Nannocystis sp.]